jgi:hypothetical protein
MGAMTCNVGGPEQQAGWRLVGRIAGLWLALFAVTAVGHAGEGRALSRAEIPQIQKTRASLLQREFAGLAPSRKGETEIYTLAIAGWADQDVFIKELNGALAAIASVLPIKGHTARLINHRETVNTVPLANLPNFTQAVDVIGNIMDKDNDVFILLKTSHGDRTGFAFAIAD